MRFRQLLEGYFKKSYPLTKHVPMPTRQILLLIAGLPVIVTLCAKKSVPDFPVDIAYVREMSCIPEVDTWNRCPESGFSKDSIAVAAVWDTLRSKILPFISPQTVKNLSNRAPEQMTGYTKTPDLMRLCFSPCRFDANCKKILFQATVDTLPSLDPIVTRYLKLYLMYDPINQKVQRATFTIRGEVKE
jgi:hypothetical protein